MIEQADNSCLKYCRGACCKNVALFSVTTEELALFSKTVKKSTTDDVLDMVFQFQGPAVEDVYFATDKRGMNIVGIKGNCPNLLLSYECGIYDARPDACKSLAVGSQNCKVARKKEGIKPLDKITPYFPINFETKDAL